MPSWFDVDREGLAAILERRGKAFVIAELLSNAWDSGSSKVCLSIDPIPGRAASMLKVEDWGDGFDDLAKAYTIFSRSARAADAEKRGRFSLGEKLVLACCIRAEIITTTGGIIFEGSHRRRKDRRRAEGTLFVAEVRMTRSEYEDVMGYLSRVIPPVPTILNGALIEPPREATVIEARLPTEYADETGMLRRSMRKTAVQIIPAASAADGEILEMGIPVVECDMPFRVNVLQKIPVNMDRDNVTPAFLKAVQAEVLNAMHQTLDPSLASEAWVSEAASDPRASAAAVGSVIRERFGERAVVAVPSDPLANAQAEANGYTVVHGGAMPSGMWANVRKAEAMLPASRVFPTPSAAVLSEQRAGRCPACGK